MEMIPFKKLKSKNCGQKFISVFSREKWHIAIDKIIKFEINDSEYQK